MKLLDASALLLNVDCGSSLVNLSPLLDLPPLTPLGGLTLHVVVTLALELSPSPLRL